MTDATAPTHAADLIDQLARYALAFPDERACADAIADFLRREPRPFHRSTPGAHLTASAFIVDVSARSILMIHHRSLQRWLQPGGHIDEGEELPLAALREAVEETGLHDLALVAWNGADALPFDIDSHPIPANPKKGEAAHVHHDIRYLLAGRAAEVLAPDAGEVYGARWLPIAELDAYLPPRVRIKLERLL